ncbi:DUF2490 domain-containing protein [Psychroserpens mesophilus]|uniref:DUF2490 domain-containing protein n=1 Tax=Psychroserpens mesophilus TaxID=325473 RepID=UPI003D653FD4
MKYLFFLILLYCGSLKGKAQESLTLFFEPEVEFNYNITSKYSHSFGIENRNYIYRMDDFQYQVKHLEFAHTSTYALNETQALSLGLQYRFEEHFIASEENEFRLLQAFEWASSSSQLNLKQELQTELRFFKSTTKYRLRYELGLKFPLSKTNNYIITETESLFEIAKTQKPELEQRLSLMHGWSFNPKTSLEIGLQYRLADYIQNSEHELFLVCSYEIDL